jgi:tryptophan 2,3-dioxygenase
MTYYHSYLGLDELLSAQHPLSSAHEEMLFIITHQTHELWFKQILHELESAKNILAQHILPDQQLLLLHSRLRRITEIQKVLIAQIRVLETMTPMEFLDFRDHLNPASGFQSMQFRLVENTLGLTRDTRIKYKKAHYCQFLTQEHQSIVNQAELEPNIHQLVDQWLARLPILVYKDFDFWKQYQHSVNQLLIQEEKSIRIAQLNETELQERLQSVQNSRDSFRTIFEENIYNEHLAHGKRRLSYQAWKAALFINLYRDTPAFQMPFQILSLLVDIDELLTSWRVSHSLMVHRMLGLKSGTGGSSGYEYLKATATYHKCFPDLFNISEYLIPKSFLPSLPKGAALSLTTMDS